MEHHEKRRESGVLLPVFSLPGAYGIGCFSRHARRWVDFLADAGQSYWQILPLGPTGYGDSPYQSFSTFAGNPYFIDLEELVRRGELSPADCACLTPADASRVDYEALYKLRLPLLRRAFASGEASDNADYRRFRDENAHWLDDYALFMALKDKFGGKPWTEWPEDLRLRRRDALERARLELSEEIAFQKRMQWEFARQWEALREYAHGRGVRIIGDIPIYVAMDSADAWANPELFQLDADNRPTAVAGCPPDGFSAIGQLWGNPLYRWDYHKETGYRWWMERLSAAFRLYDVLRIDHFRGFDEYYAIAYGETTAINGHWCKGPGLDFFRAMERQLGRRDVIAEDLGYVTDSVRQLVTDTGFPGMKVLQFAFDSRDTGSAADYLPHNYPVNSVAYTGTHDNETSAGWLNDIKPEELRQVREYLCDYYTPDAELVRPFVSLAMGSPARLCVIPLQDYMGLGNSCRINRPSSVGENWLWRVREESLSDALRQKIADVTRRYGRFYASCV
ncbi:MAG: 4-alpha-glucanotransferase [Oscillibacter sp.]|nr:4-alpha-glucanotransferase [Oscillibacter sp.]